MNFDLDAVIGLSKQAAAEREAKRREEEDFLRMYVDEEPESERGLNRRDGNVLYVRFR